MRLLIFILSFTSLAAGCQTTTDNTVKEFKKIDSSLLKSNKILFDGACTILYNQIQDKKNKNPYLALQADTMYQATQEVYTFIDSLNLQLKNSDPSGTQLNVGSNLLVKTKVGDKLTDKLRAVFFAIPIFPDRDTDFDAEEIFAFEKEFETDKNWLEKYFDKTPTVAAITILNKFKNSCTNLALLSLTTINNELSK